MYLGIEVSLTGSLAVVWTGLLPGLLVVVDGGGVVVEIGAGVDGVGTA